MKKNKEDKEDTLLIVQKLQSNNKQEKDEVFQQIYNEHLRDLLTISYSLLNDLNLAEDVTENLFVSIYESPEKIKAKKSLKRYLDACVANRCRGIIRKRKPQPTSLCEASSKYSNTKDPESEAEISEESQIVSSALNKLCYKDREVIILRLRSRMTYQEITNTIGTPIGTIKSRYSRGLQKLRSILIDKLK